MDSFPAADADLTARVSGGDVNVNWASVNIAPAGGETTPTGMPVLAGPVEFR